jgi:ell wall binding domain 2 (CWB2)
MLKRLRSFAGRRSKEEPAPAAEEGPKAPATGGAAPGPEASPKAPATGAKRRRLRRPRLRRRRPDRPPPRRPSRGILLGVALTLLLVGAGIGVFLIVDSGGEDEERPAPAPQVVVRTEEEPEEPPDLGFPAFATKNTTRISGTDAVADAAGAALAVFPSTGGVEGPDAVALVPSGDWGAGVAASVLASEQIRAPVLLGEADGVPDLTVDALVSLAPQGSPATDDAQLFQIGDVEAPDGLRAKAVRGDDPAELAAEIESLRRELTGEDPRHILLAPADEPAFAMPAAAWAARSGDPVLFVERNSVPDDTLETLERYEDVPVYLLGPEQAASDRVVEELEEADIDADRVAGEDPVENAINFARFASPDGFGWGITDPGHGLVIANAERPADAGAAAVLSASGKWGPLLLIERADELPPSLEGFLLDIKPGYVDDPTRALYNHVWLVGDAGAIGVDVQAQIDELAELAKVESSAPETAPGQPEPEDEPDQGNQ